MRNAFCFPKRVIVDMGEGAYATGDLKYTRVDGRFVVQVDGECSEHDWAPEEVEFFDDCGGEVN